MKNRKINAVVIFTLTLVVLVLAFKDDFSSKIMYLFSFNFWYLVLAFLMIIIYYLLKGLVIYYCSKRFRNDYKFGNAFKLILDTQFVNGVTPFSSGGQPYQIYRLKKQGFSIDKGTNIAIQDFIVYQIALILLGSLAIAANQFLNLFPDNLFLKKLVIIGYIVNFVVIIVLFVIAFNKKGNKFLFDLIIKIGAKLKFIKDEKRFLMNSEIAISNFHDSAVKLMDSKFHFVRIIFINFVALIVLYLIPFVLILGLGEYINPLYAIITSSYVMLIGSFIPTPGGSGGLEYSFTVFFGAFIVGSKLSIIMIAWRFITYYFGLIVGAISINTREEEK